MAVLQWWAVDINFMKKILAIIASIVALAVLGTPKASASIYNGTFIGNLTGNASSSTTSSAVNNTNFIQQWNGVASTGTVASATTAGTATNLAGGSGTYVVQTNGWYTPLGTWNAETNAGNSLQHALNFAALYNPEDAYRPPSFITNGYASYQWIIRLPYWVGGIFAIGPGKFLKPDGSAYCISNQIMTSAWKLIGSSGTELTAKSNVIAMAIQNKPNGNPAAFGIELGGLGILSESNVCAIQVNMLWGAQHTYVHDCYFSIDYFVNNPTNGNLMEDAIFITGSQGMVGLALGGTMGTGIATRNTFHGLANGMICPEESTYVNDNNFYSICEWTDTNSVIHYSNLWSTNDATDVVGDPNLISSIYGAELSKGGALIVNSPNKSFFDRNFFFGGRTAIYVGVNAGKSEIKDNCFQQDSGMTNILVAATTAVMYGDWTTVRLLNNDWQSAPVIRTLNWDGATIPLPTTTTPVDNVNTLTANVSENNGALSAASFTGSGSGLTNLTSVIKRGTTNATTLTSFTATFTGTAFPDTNYTAVAIGDGFALAGSYVSAKTTTSCVFNMTIATGLIDWMAIHP
jgi:hypothetical protein